MAEIQVGTALEWGIDNTFAGFVLASLDENLDPRVKVEVPDEQGVVKTVIYQDATGIYNLDAAIADGTTLPAVGDTITDGGSPAKKYLLDSLQVRSVSEGVRRVSMVLKDYEGITLP